MQKESFLIVLFFLFWVTHIVRRNFFWLYFWQKRGSRFNRFLNGLRENIRVLFSKSALFALALLLFLPYLSRINFLFEGLVFALYAILGSYSLYLLIASVFTRDFKGYFVIPGFKKRMLFLFLFIVSLEILFLATLIAPNIIAGNYNYPLTLILTFEIFFPLFFLLSVFVFRFFSSFVYKVLEGKAKKKISQHKDLITIGICGSYGKTLTKEFLFQLLSKKYKALKTEGEEAGIEDIIDTINRNLKKSHEVFICEISAYKKGEVDRICDILLPKMGILTGISEDHLSLFGSLKNILNTKFELINCLPEDGVGIFNIENKESQKLFQRASIKKYSYSTSEEKGDIFAKNVVQESSEDKVSFDIITPKGEEKVILNSPEKKNVENFLGAAVCALQLGMSLSEVKEIAEKIKMPEGFMTHKDGRRGVQVIDDTASHAPNGFFAALNYLKKYDGKKVIIASSLPELGKAAHSIHNNIGKKIGEICDLAIIITPTFFKEIRLGASAAGMKKGRITFLRSPRKILKRLNPYFKKKNVILLEGEISAKIKREIVER
jgi:UDP-N-acetylmuramoyl-tripeptide--D-alanyl-D-alanine ligase